MEGLERRINRRVARLPAGLQAHIQRVKEIAEELAPLHGVDLELASLAALAHDAARAMPDAELLAQARRLDVPVGFVDEKVPVLLHGPVGAEILRREDGLNDASIHAAVYWHTYAHPSLDALGKIVFLADKLDPQKARRYPYQTRLRELAGVDLDRAILEFLTNELAAQTRRGHLIHPQLVESRNHLISSLGWQG